MITKELESRVIRLEQKLAAVQDRIEAVMGKENHPNPFGAWWIETAGRFKDDPIFDEIVRLGRKYRESKLPEYMKKRRRTQKKKHARA